MQRTCFPLCSLGPSLRPPTLRASSRTWHKQSSLVGRSSVGSLERISNGLVVYTPEPGLVIYGVDHDDSNPGPGELILRTKPAAVVVESALTLAHGSKTGNSLLLAELEKDADAEFHIKVYCTLARQLGREPQPYLSEEWRALRGKMSTEQLVWVSALAANVPLIYGDVAKTTTFARLYGEASLADLDDAFGRGVEHSFRCLLARYPEDTGISYEDIAAGFHPGDRMQDILFAQRDRTLYSTLKATRAKHADGIVVGVVGEYHLEGIKQLFDSRAPVVSTSPLQEAALADKGRKGSLNGVQRALADRALQMVCSQDFTEDLEREFGKPEEALQGDELVQYNKALELYGLTRVMMASLSKDTLSKMVSGYKCDLHDALAPFRTMRPSQGGRGFSEEATGRQAELDRLVKDWIAAVDAKKAAAGAGAAPSAA